MSIASIVVGFVLKQEIFGKEMAPQIQQSFTIGIFYILIFMWVLGIPFLIIISTKGISLIANEFQEGTMSLLVSTKLSRIKIVLYKWLAIFLSLILLGILAIFENLSILYLISGMNDIILNQLIQTVPSLLMYLLFIGFVFSSISILLSLIIKSKVIAIIVMITIIILIFLIIPLFKNFLIGYYENYYLYLIDLNYHLSMIYYYFISQNNVELTPSIQITFGTFIGIFDLNSITDSDIVALTGKNLLTKASIHNYLNVRHLIIAWGFIGILSLGSSMFVLHVRDVN